MVIQQMQVAIISQLQQIIKQATSETHQNIVLLAHDTDAKDTTVAALPSIIQYYKEKGYQFLGIDDESYYVHHDIQN